MVMLISSQLVFASHSSCTAVTASLKSSLYLHTTATVPVYHQLLLPQYLYTIYYNFYYYYHQKWSDIIIRFASVWILFFPFTLTIRKTCEIISRNETLTKKIDLLSLLRSFAQGECYDVNDDGDDNNDFFVVVAVVIILLWSQSSLSSSSSSLSL